jgi:hypothetical protein
VGIGVQAGTAAEALTLEAAGPLHPRSDGGAGFLAQRSNEITVGDGRHLQVDVDPVQQRPGDPRSVAFDLQRSAAARVDRIVEIAAGASLRCLGDA